ncbi:MAG: NADH-quinone oxidoreductase subunit L [Bacteroidota bacterium]|jgi:NADH-quinone oxidoreductase subunit L|nr:NADH-quinone oxidoreductase subunit L [Bacteroidota bacterium]MCA6442711.1 NADH-quinone oxidoreductase subunit L [Bacteroidota bacterium]
MIKLIPLVPLFPLLGFLVNGFFGKKLSKSLSGSIASIAVLASFIISVLAFIELNGSTNKSNVIDVFSWINAGDLKIPFQFLYDNLSSLFLLIITGIGFLIHVYSTGYMHDDEGFSRFFTYLNLFVFFMLLLVLGNNYLITFVGWEGVGLCSYLLIGFWFKNTAYNNAAKKAFIMNRIGDLGFLLGIFLIYITFGSITYTDIFDKAGSVPTSTITAIALLLFVGAMGKSAQLPLYTWLPDAMAGPTPVSALIHAATMVTAGIFMVVRSNIFYSISDVASETVAIVGGITALFAACIGLLQNDIKKILAYSTVSQLGLMFLGLGVGAYSSAVFHVTTHAFFKALLFLGAGSVIHAMGGEQDIRKMGGLKGKIKITFLTMFIATIAISGLPPFSGFFSKDELLAHVYEHSKALWLVGMLTSILTAFYMFRMLYLTFYGKFRGTHEQEHHLHESPPSMTFPLIILAILSALGGLLGLPEFLHLPNWMHHQIGEVIIMKGKSLITLSHEVELILMCLAVAAAAASIFFAYNLYLKNKVLPVANESELKSWQRLIYNKFYVDEIYEALIRKPIDAVSDVLYKYVDVAIIDGVVNGVGSAVKGVGSVVRLAQNGNIGFYIISMIMGIVFIVLFTLLYR